MTFNEAEKMCERIEGYVIGSFIKDMKIDSLWIGPTNWEEVCEYMNSQVQKGMEVTLIEFAKRSFSVYGVSVTHVTGGVPRHDMIRLDDYEKMMCN